MKFSIVTLFPEIFSGVFEHSIIGRAVKESRVQINLVNLRDFGIGPHKIVDDKPYGGGTGMVLRVDVLNSAINSVKENEGNEKVAILDARGEVYSQKIAEDFSKLDHLILICGRYEGFDERIKEFVDFSISIGDYVLTGGEIPAMSIVDSTVRLIPGVLSKDDATVNESFSQSEHGRILEHPQYTRPENYEDLRVPEVLLSGHAANISNYKSEESLRVTSKNRKDIKVTTPSK